nr:MAG TPA: hypothetical protein [Caudoviricetes sp.]
MKRHGLRYPKRCLFRCLKGAFLGALKAVLVPFSHFLALSRSS